MFLLLDNNIIVQQSMEIMPLLNRLGFISNSQYYRMTKNKTKKFNHIKDRFKIINIDQDKFFSDNMLYYGRLTE